MYVLVTYKNVDDLMKNERPMSLNVIQLYFRFSRAANSVDIGLMSLKIELIQAFMVVLVTGKNEEGPLKMKAIV